MYSLPDSQYLTWNAKVNQYMRIKKGAQDLIIYVILYVQSECRDTIGRKTPIVFDFRNLWHVATLNAFLCV